MRTTKRKLEQKNIYYREYSTLQESPNFFYICKMWKCSVINFDNWFSYVWSINWNEDDQLETKKPFWFNFVPFLSSDIFSLFSCNFFLCDFFVSLSLHLHFGLDFLCKLWMMNVVFPRLTFELNHVTWTFVFCSMNISIRIIFQ